jgi:hypothetical protein
MRTGSASSSLSALTVSYQLQITPEFAAARELGSDCCSREHQGRVAS